MTNKYYCFILVIFSFLIFPSFSNAQTTADFSVPDTLLVGVAGSQPFVYPQGSNEKGIAIDIWESLAEKKDWIYIYKFFNTVDEAIHALENEGLDVIVGPISITSERIEYWRFSQPFYNSSLAIVSRQGKLNLWDKIKPFFSLNLLYAVFVFVFILSIVGTLFWLAERKESPDQFPKDPVNGIGNGMWMAIVTMTTVGYGDKAPITLMGRIIAGSWMVISIIFATSMVAGIASTLTLSSMGTSVVTNIEELSGKEAATIGNSPSVGFLKENKVKPIGVNSLEEAMEMLRKKEVDAVVYDRPQLLFYLAENQKDKFHIAQAEYYKQGYGFAFSMDSKLVYDVNRLLLELAEEQDVAGIVGEYLEE
ncbi:transporter substrate-binding domain-containing protein [Brumimicrobium mesophilum]|uniref:transporter substrate-binding domain-containing protein n=1 Tax=Brumimicrobium mesophilum TaxID=392717 RepID=UPI000D13F016|nr:transporter substrate-binding domain-containing protein [Brumimicrobium mesophilum]